MNGPRPFAVRDDSVPAFAAAYVDYTGTALETVSAIVESATDWHRRSPVLARTGMLDGLSKNNRQRLQREEKQAQRACRQYVRQTVPQSLGILGWIQIGLWLWRHRLLIADIIQRFRAFLAERPAAFQTMMERM